MPETSEAPVSETIANDQVVLFEELDAANGKKIAKATLNIPKTLNSLTSEMVELMIDQFTKWQSDENVACLFIDGSGEKAFCAGGDVQALHASAVATPGGPCVEAETFFAREYRLDYLLHSYPKPVVVWGDGIVMGGGLGIFAGGSHRIVTETSRFAMPEVTIGLFPDVGGSYFLNNMPGKAGRFLALTGASFNAADAIFTGVANVFVSRDRYKDVLNALIAAAPTDTKTVDAVLEDIVGESQDAIPDGNVEPHMPMINQLCESDNIEEVVATFAALETDDKWLVKARKSIAHGSPLSVVLIDQQLVRCKDMALNDVFRSELILATNIVRYPEFAEGVRALLIDKDQSPKWNFANVQSIDADFIERFFEAPWSDNPLADI